MWPKNVENLENIDLKTRFFKNVSFEGLPWKNLTTLLKIVFYWKLRVKRVWKLFRQRSIFTWVSAVNLVSCSLCIECIKWTTFCTVVCIYGVASNKMHIVDDIYYSQISARLYAHMNTIVRKKRMQRNFCTHSRIFIRMHKHTPHFCCTGAWNIFSNTRKISNVRLIKIIFLLHFIKCCIRNVNSFLKKIPYQGSSDENQKRMKFLCALKLRKCKHFLCKLHDACFVPFCSIHKGPHAKSQVVSSIFSTRNIFRYLSVFALISKLVNLVL